MRWPRRSDASRSSRLLVLAAAVTASLSAPVDALGQQDLDVPYVPTPIAVVDTMLALTNTGPGDTVYDLGSGDGRIVIRAARTYGARGVGVEIDSGRVAEARRNAAEAGVDDRVRFVHGDLFEVDVSPATVVTLYLLSSVNRKLRPKLLRELRPGTRVASHDFDMSGWRADSVVTVEPFGSTVFYWVVPVNVAGRWRVRLPEGRQLALEIRQKFQELRASRASRSAGTTVESARVRGDSVSFSLVGEDGRRVTLRGTAGGDRMSGTTARGRSWSAIRTSGAGQPLDRWRPGAPKRAPAAETQAPGSPSGGPRGAGASTGPAVASAAAGVDEGRRRSRRQAAPQEAARTEARHRMVREHIADPPPPRKPVRDEAVLEAMRAVRRHRFVPAALRGRAYEDTPLPIGRGQTISQPYVVARMTELLELEPGSRVLEVGTGSGYQAAVLAEIADSVFSVEIIGALARSARLRLERLGYDNVRVRHGDGYGGWPEHAPFDAIIVTAAPDHVPDPLVGQLAPGGRLVLPEGPEGGVQRLTVVRKKEDGTVQEERLSPVRFVPLRRDTGAGGGS